MRNWNVPLTLSKLSIKWTGWRKPASATQYSVMMLNYPNYPDIRISGYHSLMMLTILRIFNEKSTWKMIIWKAPVSPFSKRQFSLGKRHYLTINSPLGHLSSSTSKASSTTSFSTSWYSGLLSIWSLVSGWYDLPIDSLSLLSFILRRWRHFRSPRLCFLFYAENRQINWEKKQGKRCADEGMFILYRLEQILGTFIKERTQNQLEYFINFVQ